MGSDFELRQAENVEPGAPGEPPASVNRSARSSPRGPGCLEQVGRIRAAMRSRKEAAGHFKGKATRVGRENTEALNKPTKPLALDCPVNNQAAKHKGKRHFYDLYDYHRANSLRQVVLAAILGGGPNTTHAGRSPEQRGEVRARIRPLAPLVVRNAARLR